MSGFLKVENTSEKENKTAEVILAVPGDDIVVKKTCATFEEAIDKCHDIAKKLLIKKKEKIKIFFHFFDKIFVYFKKVLYICNRKREQLFT